MPKKWGVNSKYEFSLRGWVKLIARAEEAREKEKQQKKEKKIIEEEKKEAIKWVDDDKNVLSKLERKVLICDNIINIHLSKQIFTSPERGWAEKERGIATKAREQKALWGRNGFVLLKFFWLSFSYSKNLVDKQSKGEKLTKAQIKKNQEELLLKAMEKKLGIKENGSDSDADLEPNPNHIQRENAEQDTENYSAVIDGNLIFMSESTL